MTTNQHWKIATYLHKRIFIQLIIFAIISIVMFGVVIYDVVTKGVNPLWVLVALIVGLLLGVIVGRAFKLKWHEDTQKVIMNVDKTGFVIIALYVVIRSVTNNEAHALFNGVELSVVTFSLLGGIMLGRIASMWRRIVLLLQEQGLLEKTKK